MYIIKTLSQNMTKAIVSATLCSIVVALLAAMSPNASAQTDLTTGSSEAMKQCGTVITEEHIRFIRDLSERGLLPSKAIPSDYRLVNVVFHVIRSSGGTGGLSVSRIAEALDSANAHYASTRILFHPVQPVQYVNNDTYHDTLTDAEADELRLAHNEPGAIRIFFVPRFGPCGRSSFPGDIPQGIIMDNDCTANSPNHSSFTHEIGHYIDLYHPHSTAHGQECVDGANCSTAGDMVCDTPADPTLGSSNVDSDCLYTGSATDSCDGATYFPLTDNIMSYAPKKCRTLFTAGQRTKASSDLDNLRLDHIVDSSPCGQVTYVNQFTGGSGGTWSDPYTSVALGVANACNGGFVSVFSGTYNEAPITFDTPVKLIANSADVTIK